MFHINKQNENYSSIVYFNFCNFWITDWKTEASKLCRSKVHWISVSSEFLSYCNKNCYCRFHILNIRHI